jgi:hypothetical protein
MWTQESSVMYYQGTFLKKLLQVKSVNLVQELQQTVMWRITIFSLICVVAEDVDVPVLAGSAFV